MRENILKLRRKKRKKEKEINALDDLITLWNVKWCEIWTWSPFKISSTRQHILWLEKRVFILERGLAHWSERFALAVMAQHRPNKAVDSKKKKRLSEFLSLKLPNPWTPHKNKSVPVGPWVNTTAFRWWTPATAFLITGKPIKSSVCLGLTTLCVSEPRDYTWIHLCTRSDNYTHL